MPRPRSDIQERITDVAREQFSAHGVDGASLRNIAKEAGTSIGMVYYYFPTKDDLFLAVVESVYVGVLDKLTTALEAPAGDGAMRPRVEALYGCFGELTPRELEVLRLVVREALVSSDRLERLIERFKRGHLPLIVQTIMGGFQRGEIDGSHHPFVAMICMGAIGILPQVLGRALGRHFPPPNVPQGPALARELADIYLRGIGPVAAHQKQAEES